MSDKKELSNFRNEEALQKLARILQRRPLTARQIAKATGFSKPATYRHLTVLRLCGFSLAKQKTREGKTGPKSVAYVIAKSKAAPKKQKQKPTPKKRVKAKAKRTVKRSAKRGRR